MTRRCIILFGLVGGLTAVAGAGEPFAQMNGAADTTRAEVGTAHVYKSEASVVSLGVAVTDTREHEIRGLTKEDFAIFEDGRPQQLQYFAAEPTPLDQDTQRSHLPVSTQFTEHGSSSCRRRPCK
jgi:hypothetical protein